MPASPLPPAPSRRRAGRGRRVRRGRGPGGLRDPRRRGGLRRYDCDGRGRVCGIGAVGGSVKRAGRGGVRGAGPRCDLQPACAVHAAPAVHRRALPAAHPRATCLSARPSPLLPPLLPLQTPCRTTACRGRARPRCSAAAWATAWRARATRSRSWCVRAWLRMAGGVQRGCDVPNRACDGAGSSSSGWHACARLPGASLLSCIVSPPAALAPPPSPAQDEDEAEQGLLGWHGPPGRQQQLALPGREAPLALQSRVSARRRGSRLRPAMHRRCGPRAGLPSERPPARAYWPRNPTRPRPSALLPPARRLPSCPQEQQVGNSLIPGFVKATATLTLPYFPPPRLPPGYVPLHRPARGADDALPAGAPDGRLPWAVGCPWAELGCWAGAVCKLALPATGPTGPGLCRHRTPPAPRSPPAAQCRPPPPPPQAPTGSRRRGPTRPPPASCARPSTRWPSSWPATVSWVSDWGGGVAGAAVGGVPLGGGLPGRDSRAFFVARNGELGVGSGRWRGGSCGGWHASGWWAARPRLAGLLCGPRRRGCGRAVARCWRPLCVAAHWIRPPVCHPTHPPTHPPRHPARRHL